jgi:hypothetical protein
VGRPSRVRANKQTNKPPAQTTKQPNPVKARPAHVPRSHAAPPKARHCLSRARSSRSFVPRAAGRRCVPWLGRAQYSRVLTRRSRPPSQVQRRADVRKPIRFRRRRVVRERRRALRVPVSTVSTVSTREDCRALPVPVSTMSTAGPSEYCEYCEHCEYCEYATAHRRLGTSRHRSTPRRTTSGGWARQSRSCSAWSTGAAIAERSLARGDWVRFGSFCLFACVARGLFVCLFVYLFVCLRRSAPLSFVLCCADGTAEWQTVWHT